MANLEQLHLRSWLECHGHGGLNTIIFVQSGARLSTSEWSPLLYAFASSSTEPLKGCSIVESVISRLKVSTSTARSFLKDSVFWMGAGLMTPAVNFTAKWSRDI